MARFILFSILAGLLTVQQANAQDVTASASNGSTLTVEVVGFKSDKGSVSIALYDKVENFEAFSGPYAEDVLAIREDRTTWVVENVPPGEYVVSVYHDENDNGELDANFMRIPKEPYGFSNDARGRFGPAKWKDARFTLAGEPHTLTIRVK